ncbi:hypothetical protein Ciccas_004966 [Cichlidogyrus casuarinus]|uniref:Uncharacterized protein n=1 Tax=Cichlidogyrus casuarinus TaxID=1844966 RepID=A0ABD2QA07_9PLAT
MLSMAAKMGLNWNVPPKKMEAPSWTKDFALRFLSARRTIFDMGALETITSSLNQTHEVVNLMDVRIKPLINLHNLHSFFESIMLVNIMNSFCIKKAEASLGKSLVQLYFRFLGQHHTFFDKLQLTNESSLNTALELPNIAAPLPYIKVSHHNLVQFAAACIFKQAAELKILDNRLGEMRGMRYAVEVEFAAVRFMRCLRHIRADEERLQQFSDADQSWVKANIDTCALEKYINGNMTTKQETILLSLAAFPALLNPLARANKNASLVIYTQAYLDFIGKFDEENIASDYFVRFTLPPP